VSVDELDRSASEARVRTPHPPPQEQVFSDNPFQLADLCNWLLPHRPL
jgi:hypothetical protein